MVIANLPHFFDKELTQAFAKKFGFLENVFLNDRFLKGLSKIIFLQYSCRTDAIKAAKAMNGLKFYESVITCKLLE